MAAEEGVPIWGIEVGIRAIRAARVSRRKEGGYWLLDYREEPLTAPGPDGLLAFLRRRRLVGHPLVIAIDSPSTRFRTVALPSADAASDDPHSALMEYVHPEPEEIEMHSVVLGPATHLLCAEDRARIESYLIALERADLPAYALVSALPAVYEVVRRTGLFEGDGLALRVGPTWTDLLFLDGDGVRHLALPVGSEALDGSVRREAFAADVQRLLDYHRTRAPREDSERIVLLGLGGAEADAVGSLLPTRPIPFPGDAGPVRGKGRITLMTAMEVLRTAPAAVGAAIAGASEPRRMELAYRKLPEKLPSPPQPLGAWLAAAVLVLVAAGLVFFGVDRDRKRLREALAATGSAPVTVPADQEASFRRLAATARQRLSFSEATARLGYVLPGEESAPWQTESIDLESTPEGTYSGRIGLRLPGGAAEDAAARVEAAVHRAEQATGRSVARRRDGDDIVLTATFSLEEDR